ncbi:uncharacterized protein TNCV_3501721 [Trichonephila clavipes]|uniref:Uncharacterized protein n=1 Tax=Trichonephila clavipes TaxID=2585209 RepID=A0A8X6S0N3_TRICX|nr:uncharacterized protein TNCV_3501721 [Trichonephila clavipes]
MVKVIDGILTKHLQDPSRCLELEAKAATYTNDSLKALRIISKQLDVKAENTEKELNKLNDKLLQYKFLGPHYEELVEEYRLLVQSIEKQKWAIKSLKTKEGEMSSEILET